jgi:hypothetical protein
LIVVQGTFDPIPPRIDACLAGACPIPDPMTFPSMTSSTNFGYKLMEFKAPLIANPASSGAENCDKRLLNEPIGVLLAATMYTDRPICFEVPKKYFIMLIFY